jgi:hypothetical protein
MKRLSIRRNLGYFLIGFDGVSIIVMALILESSGAEAERFDLISYLATQPRLEYWWTTFGIPYLAGIAFIVAAIAGPAIERSVGGRWPFFLGCVAFSFALMLTVGGFGTFALIASLIAALAGLQNASHESLQEPG